MMRKLLLFLFVFIIIDVSANPLSTLPTASNQPSIAEFLNVDGTLNLTTGFTGSLNLSGFEVQMDACKGIIAKPELNPIEECNPNKTNHTEAIQSTWSALGSGLSGTCFTIAISGSDVYAGGSFTIAGGSSASRIAKWNGTSWSALGSGLGGACFMIAISGSDVYAGGTFTTAGGGSANRIAKWNGTSWSALGSGLSSTCFTIAISGSDVYAGGQFTAAGGSSANNIAKWNGTSWSTLGSGLTSNVQFNGLALGADGLYVGGQFTAAGGSSANYIAKWDGASLPVEFTYFKGQATTTSSLLQWQTASEQNNEGFDIQRSADGKNWETIDFAQGHGTTQEVQDYTFTDENPQAGMNYYRLKQMDFDGQFEYSDIVNVELGIRNDELETFPNPVKDELNIVNGQGQATIFNILGQPVKKILIPNSQFVIPTTDLPKGQYVLSIQQKNGNVITKRFVK